MPVKSSSKNQEQFTFVISLYFFRFRVWALGLIQSKTEKLGEVVSFGIFQLRLVFHKQRLDHSERDQRRSGEPLCDGDGSRVQEIPGIDFHRPHFNGLAVGLVPRPDALGPSLPLDPRRPTINGLRKVQGQQWYKDSPVFGREILLLQVQDLG